MKKIKKEKIDKLVETIDNLMQQGTGHVNVSNFCDDDNIEVHHEATSCKADCNR